jgi:hypothetical protein
MAGQFVASSCSIDLADKRRGHNRNSFAFRILQFSFMLFLVMMKVGRNNPLSVKWQPQIT